MSMEHRAQRIILPKREVKKWTFTLPTDIVEFLDECAEAIGQDRSGFLAIIIDAFYDEIASFAKGYGYKIVEQREKVQKLAFMDSKNKKK